ncbi:AfsR/SARP family transcriptional regulator [Verrucosispora sp. WMMA2121]|uniref:AfsR/SARP family transcriptional regulator n=1 Tax=Verrucosispora sp. WMMA2121 TaxID=3015164 RepID=UPI0022B6D3EB|nr:AfsR/SARP family transcriptional regulator [Verrucosispora sp. WMMA2121]MCZ7419379.1 AfsR/SARP family transcriptional regulator [Verrucosispora sp. WMMA2121]
MPGRLAGTVKIYLLGPLTVRGETGARRPDGKRARSLLALLLLHANALVPMNQIVDEVWGMDPPRTVRTQVHGQISLLRRFLRGVPDVELHTLATGYLLRADVNDIDVTEFRHRAQRGRALVALGRPQAAAEAFREALRLHTGPPLGDVDAPFVPAAVARLEEERLTVLTELIGLELHEGRHQELIPKLTALVEEHPLRESMWRHLVIALHGAGRRSEAMAAFHRARMLLREELGLDPGAELTSAYRNLLHADPVTGGQDVDLSDALVRLNEVEQALGDIRRLLLGWAPSAAWSDPSTAPPITHLRSDGGAPNPEIAA